MFHSGHDLPAGSSLPSSLPIFPAHCFNHDSCAPGEYCDSFYDCYDCTGCWQYGDPFDGGNCPAKCRNPLLECQWDAHCPSSQYCSVDNKCVNCNKCATRNNGIYGWPCSDRCSQGKLPPQFPILPSQFFSSVAVCLLVVSPSQTAPSPLPSPLRSSFPLPFPVTTTTTKPTTTTTTTTPAPGCQSHDACAANLYCDSFRNCYDCQGCWQWGDPFDKGECPSKCRDPLLQCQWDAHCPYGQYCNDQFACASCTTCATANDGAWGWSCSDRCSTFTTTETTTTTTATVATTVPGTTKAEGSYHS